MIVSQKIKDNTFVHKPKAQKQNHAMKLKSLTGNNDRYKEAQRAREDQIFRRNLRERTLKFLKFNMMII